MFAIIISEKGGAERRESFDKNEINVGRVQGNDLMLPKGNVSKHHARLLFRDGRFIVTDLKSTNGTYVNGRKIAQATIVREGDKIYIGDFVLRLETNGAVQDAPSGSPADSESIRTVARDPVAGNTPNRPGAVPPPLVAAPTPVGAPAPNVTLKAPTHPPAARPQPANAPPVALGVPAAGPAPTRVPDASYPLDQDPDDSAPAPAATAPKPAPQPPRAPSVAPPPLGGAARPLTMPLNHMAPPIIARGGPAVTAASPVGPGLATPAAMPPPLAPPPLAPPPLAPPPLPPPPQAQPAAPSPAAAHPPLPAPPPAAPPAAAPTPAATPPGRASAPPRVPPKDTAAQAGRRLALMSLLDRVADVVDLSALRASPTVPEALAQQIEKAAKDQANAMRQEGDAPEGIDLDAVVRDAHRELVGLGAFGPLLEDEEVAEIHCVRFDQVFTVRGANGAATVEPTSFSSEEALHRIIARLAQQSGEAWRAGESVVERKLPRATVVAIAPPAAANHVVSIRKRRRIETSFDELTCTGAISKAMVQFLEACVHARANILVSGNAPLPLLSALAAAFGAHGERAVVVQDVEEIGTGNAHVASLALGDARKGGEEAVRAASKLRADRLIVTQLSGGIAAAVIDAMTEGNEGVLAGLSAPTLRQGLSRLTGQLVLHRAGLSLEGIREVIGDSFDIAVEVSLFPDGRLRVVRVAELGGADAKGVVVRDLFTFSTDPQGGDGGFTSTGVVPRIANELASRGIKIDASIFKRSGR